jgi:hypothetical protein
MKSVNNNWAKVGGVVAVCIIIFVSIYKNPVFHIHSIALLNLAFLMLHQFEEYVYPGGFKQFFNTYVGGKSRIISYPLSDKAIVTINIGLGWGLYVTGVIFPNPFIIMVLLTASFINGVVHTGAFVKLKKYNPGLITGLFIFIPFSIYAANRVIDNSLMTSPGIFFSILFAIGGITLIPITVYLLRDKKLNE